MPMKKILLISVGLVSLFLLYTGFSYVHLSDGKLHIIICDVGQGDGILIKTPQNDYLTLDGGPDNSFSICLSRHMPFWQKTIALMLVSHPHADHFVGLISVLNRYSALRFGTENLKNKNTAFALLNATIQKKHIPSLFLYRGDKFEVGMNLSLQVLGPTEDFLKTTSPGNMIGESKEFGSLVLLLKYRNFSMVFPGDAQAGQLGNDIQISGLTHIDILQTPHHGSASGLTPEIVSTLSPRLAIISVGLHNRYHHPAWQTLEILKSARIPIKRTDQSGDIEIITDGKKWQVK